MSLMPGATTLTGSTETIMNTRLQEMTEGRPDIPLEKIYATDAGSLDNQHGTATEGGSERRRGRGPNRKLLCQKKELLLLILKMNKVYMHNTTQKPIIGCSVKY